MRLLFDGIPGSILSAKHCHKSFSWSEESSQQEQVDVRTFPDVAAQMCVCVQSGIVQSGIVKYFINTRFFFFCFFLTVQPGAYSCDT